MISPEDRYSTVYQGFRSKDQKEFTTLPTHICTETGDRYFLWNDVQHAFSGILHLEIAFNKKGLFMVDSTGQM